MSLDSPSTRHVAAGSRAFRSNNHTRHLAVAVAIAKARVAHPVDRVVVRSFGVFHKTEPLAAVVAHLSVHVDRQVEPVQRGLVVLAERNVGPPVALRPEPPCHGPNGQFRDRSRRDRRFDRWQRWVPPVAPLPGRERCTDYDPLVLRRGIPYPHAGLQLVSLDGGPHENISDVDGRVNGQAHVAGDAIGELRVAGPTAPLLRVGGKVKTHR